MLHATAKPTKILPSLKLKFTSIGDSAFEVHPETPEQASVAVSMFVTYFGEFFVVRSCDQQESQCSSRDRQTAEVNGNSGPGRRYLKAKSETESNFNVRKQESNCWLCPS